MDHLQVADCGTLFMNAARNVPKAKFVRLRPRDRALVASTVHVKAELEFSLRNFTALTQGDVIPIVLHGRRIDVEIVSVAPENKANVGTHGVSISSKRYCGGGFTGRVHGGHGL